MKEKIVEEKRWFGVKKFTVGYPESIKELLGEIKHDDKYDFKKDHSYYLKDVCVLRKSQEGLYKIYFTLNDKTGTIGVVAPLYLGLVPSPTYKEDTKSRIINAKEGDIVDILIGGLQSWDYYFELPVVYRLTNKSLEGKVQEFKDSSGINRR